MEEARRRLYTQIREWNENRLDLFALSEPNANLEFYGVMRFYFEDEQQDRGEKVSSKCVRVSSTASVRDVLATLVEKFRPDIRMLTASQYGLYEVHTDAPERRLEDYECPLLVQLNWGRDDREGRILMKRLATLSSVQANGFADTNVVGMQRKLSRRERKELKKKGKENKTREMESVSSAGELYNEFPESVLTRSISNPEMVMRKRRELKLEKKLQQIRTSEGGPESGGTLKIYGETICPEVPYKTLLLSETDRTSYIVKETLEKYGLSREDPRDYCLVQVITSPVDQGPYTSEQTSKEFILDDNDFPLRLLIYSPPIQGQITFHLRRRPAEMRQRQAAQMQQNVASPVRYQSPIESPFVPYASRRPNELPYLFEINGDGSDLQGAQTFIVPLNGLEVGCERGAPQGASHLLLQGHDICPRHCVFHYTDTAVTVTRLDNRANIVVNDMRVPQTVALRQSAIVLLGTGHFLRFFDPLEGIANRNPQNVSKPNVISQSLGLPAVLEYREQLEDRFLSTVLSDSALMFGRFRFIPTYSVYMAVRYVIDMQMASREKSAQFALKAADSVYQVTRRSEGKPMSLALWLANASELLNFFGHDSEVRSISVEARDQLARCVDLAFVSLVDFFRKDLSRVLPAFLDARPDSGEAAEESLKRLRGPGTGPRVNDVVESLGQILNLFLNSHVNAAFTIQLFSQLFHHINQWLFNRVVDQQNVATNASLCTRDWGWRLTNRLSMVEAWAERQGLELAAECHLARIIQAANLLQAPKSSADDIADICTACFKLNSLQLGALLRHYVPSRNEPRISQEVINRVVVVAQNTADEMALKEGQEITLFEETQLRLPFLLPEDGYLCELVKGLNEDMVNFLRPLSDAGLCRLIPGRPDAMLWTVFFGKLDQNSGAFSSPASQPTGQRVPETVLVRFQKINNSLGLSIVAAVAEGRSERSIYVKSVVPGGAAAADGRIQAGDLLLEVDGRSLQGLTQEEAAALMGRTGSVVNLLVTRHGAVFDGLAMLLNQSSPSASTNPNSARAPAGYGDTTDSQMILSRPSQPVQSASPYQPPQPVNPYQSTRTKEEVIRPAGGHYSRVVNPPPTRSKSTSNLDGTIAKYPFGQGGPAVTVLKATHNVDGTTKVSTKQVVRQQYQDPTVGAKYPYMPPPAVQNVQRSNGTNRPPDTDPRNLSKNNQSVVRTQKPVTINVPRWQVSRPYAEPNLAVSQPYLPQQPMYDQTSSRPENAYASQPNLYEGNVASAVRRNYGPPNEDPYSLAHRARSVEPGLAALPNISRPSAAYERQMRAEQGQFAGRSDRSEFNQPGRPEISSQWNRNNDNVQRAAYHNGRGQFEPAPVNSGGAVIGINEEPQYAKVAPRQQRSQSVPRTQEPAAAASAQVLGPRPTSTTSPWVREERENEMKRMEEEKRRARDEEIRYLDSRGAMISREDGERLRRLKLESDFDRRVEEMNSPGMDEMREDDIDMTAAGRANLVRVMQEDLRQRREGMEQRLSAEERRLQEWEAERRRLESESWRRDLEAGGFQQVQSGYAPYPPQRKSSSNVYKSVNENGVKPLMVTQVSSNGNKKTVSFNSNSANAQQAVKGRQQSGYPYSDKSSNFRNPNFGKPGVASPPTRFASDGFQQSHVPGTPSTPGVVGTQELYRDPRERKLAESQSQQQLRPMTSQQMPERMSFRDKMILFASEAGEDTPVDRIKNSKAQRDLEAGVNGR